MDSFDHFGSQRDEVNSCAPGIPTSHETIADIALNQAREAYNEYSEKNNIPWDEAMEHQLLADFAGPMVVNLIAIKGLDDLTRVKAKKCIEERLSNHYGLDIRVD